MDKNCHVSLISYLHDSNIYTLYWVNREIYAFTIKLYLSIKHLQVYVNVYECYGVSIS